MTPAPIIQLTGLSKVFYTDDVETHALSAIDLAVPVGEFLSIAGPSGCGKSTLLSLLGLLDTPTSGEYILNGESVANLDFAKRARIRNREIGFIFQSFNLIGDLTVAENVDLPLKYRVLEGSVRWAKNADGTGRVRITPAARSRRRRHADVVGDLRPQHRRYLRGAKRYRQPCNRPVGRHAARHRTRAGRGCANQKTSKHTTSTCRPKPS